MFETEPLIFNGQSYLLNSFIVCWENIVCLDILEFSDENQCLWHLIAVGLPWSSVTQILEAYNRIYLCWRYHCKNADHYVPASVYYMKGNNLFYVRTPTPNLDLVLSNDRPTVHVRVTKIIISAISVLMSHGEMLYVCKFIQILLRLPTF